MARALDVLTLVMFAGVAIACLAAAAAIWLAVIHYARMNRVRWLEAEAAAQRNPPRADA